MAESENTVSELPPHLRRLYGTHAALMAALRLPDPTERLLKGAPALRHHLEACAVAREHGVAQEFLNEHWPVKGVTGSVDEILRDTEKAAADLRAHDREQKRGERIAADRANQATVPVETPRCSTCRKRRSRINGLCKRCARAAGVLPFGKIGESL